MTAYTNTSLPNNGALVPENLLAPLWDDLDFAGTPHAYYHSDGSRLVIQFQDVGRLGEPGKGNTFEVVLSPYGTITYQYLAMTASDLFSATVGIQDGSRDDGLQVVFNAAYLHNSLAVRFGSPRP